MPPNHQQYVQWNGDRFRKWAEKIGINTQTVISAILSSGQDKIEETIPTISESSAKYGFTRGAEYYGGKK